MAVDRIREIGTQATSYIPSDPNIPSVTSEAPETVLQSHRHGIGICKPKRDSSDVDESHVTTTPPVEGMVEGARPFTMPDDGARRRRSGGAAVRVCAASAACAAWRATARSAL